MRTIIPLVVLLALPDAKSLAQEPASRPAEVYTSVVLADLERVGDDVGEAALGEVDAWDWIPNDPEFEPAAEGFIVHDEGNAPRQPRIVLRSKPDGDVVARVLVSRERALRNRLLMTEARVRIPKATIGNATREDFLTAGRRSYQAKLDAGLPGAAWFRHRLSHFESELPKGADPEWTRRRGLVRQNFGGANDDLSETYDFFSAGRAVSENLRLDRALTPIDGGEPHFPVDKIEGIATKAFDWKPLVEKLAPELDPIAETIPEDQHAAFFPSLIALSSTLDALDSQAAPLLLAATERFEDAGLRAFYERQLAFPVWELAQDPGIGPMITSVAVTGSDPYFATGTDIAILLACSDPEALRKALAARQESSGLVTGGSERRAGDVTYRLVTSPDRRVSSSVSIVDGAVVVTNSISQLRRIVDAAAGKLPRLAASPEYVFFRDRYSRKDAGETGFLILTDATIRRWCGPRWRIGDARRTRAAAGLAELTARDAEAIVGPSTLAGPFPSIEAPGGLGKVSLEAGKVHSSLYGNLRFLTPIVELDTNLVTQNESSAYVVFRNAYQRKWVQFFDPIAMRLELRPTGMTIDTTVMPVVASSDYRDWMDLARSVRFAPGACDPHDSAAIQLVLAVDAAAAAMEGLEKSARSLAPNLAGLALSWLKGGVSISLEQDPVLQELSERRIWEVFPRLPILLTAEVADPVALGLFIMGLRATMSDSTLETVRWTKGRHRDVDTMTIGGIEGWSSRSEPISIRYAITDGHLFVALREDVLHRAIDRVLERRAGKAVGSPWQGASAGLRVHKSFADFIVEKTREDTQRDAERRAWRALPILAEWRRLWSDQDPVAVHEKLFQVRLLDPAGGRYVVDREKNRITSETYGHPTETRPGPKAPKLLEGFLEGRAGLTFENDGVRARLVIEREKK